VAVEMNWLDRPQHLPSIPRNNPQNNAAALAVAREGIVLLKNTNSLLPLDRTKVKSVAVFGDAHSYIAGGGSSYTSPTHGKPIIDAIEAIAGNVRILDIQPWDWESQPLSKLAKASAYESLSAAFYNSSDLTGAPALKRNETTIDYDWKSNLPATGITSDKFSVRWTGIIKPAKSGPYVFATRSDDGSRVKLDGKTIVDNWRDQAAHSEASTVTLEANRTYQLIVEYYNAKGDASMQFAYVAKVPAVTDEQRAAAAAADAAVVCVHTGEAEGYDRPYHLDAGQEKLIRDVAAINPRTIVILQAGGNVGMKPWIDSAAALIDAWYPGQEGGQAIAEILFGDVNPSGHLPDTFEQEWSDSPAYGHYPGEDGKTDKVKYAEGIYVGYRWYDKNKIEPRFPFGFGLSYTTFEMKSLKPIMAGDQMSVSVDVTNTGSREGATIAELYVRPPANQSVDRPAQELKGFARVELKPGETKTVTIPLNARSFSYWDVDSHDWKALAGEYEIAIGQSSRDIQATTRVIWK
jgi:beta-glucosidase